jgi:PAS domain S-box-containing protein
MPIRVTGAPLVRSDARTIRLGHPSHPGQRSPSGRDPLRPAPVTLTEDHAHRFFELSTELFCDLDPDGRISWLNAATADALGYTEEELRGTPLGHHLHPHDRAAAESTFGIALAPAPAESRTGGSTGRAPPAPETRWRRRDGTWRWLEWTAHLSVETGMVHASARDVTDRHLARTALESSRARLQAIIDHSSSAIFVKDLEDRYTLVNDAFLEPLGLRPPDVLGRTPPEIWPGYDGAPQDNGADQVLQGAEPLTRDDVVDMADGPHTMMTVRFALRGATGAIVGMAGIATNVTDRTRVEAALAERERLLETIVQASPDIVTILDDTGHVREVSQASARILGYHLDDPIHQELEALVHVDDLPAIHRDFARLLSLETTCLDLRYRVRHAEGHWVTLDSRAQSIVGEDGRAVGALVMSRDITEDLLFEAELLSAVGVAERASQAKSEFLSRMSHELRTPLNSVLGFAQLLGMDDLSDQQEQAVGHILRAGRHLLNLIDEVLDIARIESGHLDLSVEPVLVLDVLGEAVDVARPMAEHRDIGLTVDTTSCRPGTYVLADRQRLLQVLLNLLSNATKYTSPTGRVAVTVTRTAGGRARIAVSDTGPGIAAQDIERVFEPFDRLGTERSGVKGTGVGLTLSKHLIERMGGAITVESTVAAGSTFTVNLPLTDVADDFEPSIKPAPTLHGALRILHVEDNLANLALVEQILARHQEVELIAATLGATALELARRHRPNVILLDLHLPDMSGLDVLGRLRADPITAAIPVVVVSADATTERMERLDIASVAAYLTKPIDVHELLRVIESVASVPEVAE